MVLLQIHPVNFTIFELEGDAPRAVDMDRISRWPIPSQTMEIEPREIDIRRFGRRIQRVEYQQCPDLKVRPNPTASPSRK